MIHFVRTFLIMRAYALQLSKRFEIIEKSYASKTFLKKAGGRMHIPHLTPMDPSLAISYKNHQKNLAYFSHLAPLVLFLFTKRQSQKERRHGAMAPPLNTLTRAGFRQ